MAKKTTLQAQVDELKEELLRAREEMETATQKAERQREEGEALRADNAKLQQIVQELEERPRDMYYTEEDVEELKQEIEKLKKELESSRTQQELETARAIEAIRDRYEEKEQAWLERERTWRDSESRLREGVRKLETQLEDWSSRSTVEEAPTRVEMPAEREETALETSGTAMSSRTSDVSPIGVNMAGQQIPDLPRFEGNKSGDSDTVEDWLDQLDIAAVAFKWEEEARLAHLVSRLKGAALAYYRSCSFEMRHSYSLLKEALLRRFTPIHVQSVQGTLFYQRNQKHGETAEEYAQELRLLFKKAFPKTAREAGEEGEKMLTSRFISGLRAEIQKKLTAAEGDFGQVLARARFEEAQWRELKPASRLDTTDGKTHVPSGNQGRRQSGGRPQGASRKE